MKRVAAVLLFLMNLSPLWTQPRVLTLEEATERALEQSISLQKNFIDLKTAEMRSRNIWAQVFPGISAGGGLSYSDNLFTESSSSSNQNALRLSASLSLSLQLNAGLPFTIKNINLAYRSQLLSYEHARRQIEIQITKVFHSLMASQKNLDLLEYVLNLTERQFERDGMAFRNGYLGELALLRSRLSVESARLNLSKTRTAYNSALGEFLVLLGLDQFQETELRGSMDMAKIDADPERLISEYLPKRPDIVSQRQTIERLENTRKQAAASSRAPSVNLSGSYSGNYSGSFSDSLSGSVNVSIPIDSWIPNSKDSQSIKAADADIEKALLDLKDTENSAMSEIRSLTANLRDSWSSIEMSRLRVEIAERSYALTEEGFQNGTVEFLDLEDTRRSMAEAQYQLLNDELSYKIMILDLAVALNVDWKDLAERIR